MQEEKTKKKIGLSSETMEDIAERLSKLENLYFPRALQPSSSFPSQRKSLLRDLLSRDLAVFLERYGTQLTFEELKEFEFMKDDYEINWHLNNLRSLISPTTKELKSRSKKITNRRRAYMDRLICDGKYFSEDAMREREPYLHHEYVGKFQDPSGRRMARPGERWSAQKDKMFKGQQKKKSIPPSRHGKIPHTRKGKRFVKPLKVTKEMDADRELSKFINHCNEVKAATVANKEGGQLSIVKAQPESTDGGK